ncbi:MAG TPA: AAA family ATPase [Candidatus Dormibacteraeota bacterium]|nr:AAA family ATPase [Candidatus Dormibacteraeota bacterium]
MRACPKCGEPNAELARFCLNCGTPLSPDGTSVRAHETRRRVTVLFADLVGSTTIGERLDPEALREVQQRYFDAVRVAIERHEGTVEKFIGDAVMAVFGIPQVHEDDALRAVRSAFDMQRSLGALNRDLEARWGVRLVIRVGINTGVVVAGDATTRQSLATGDVVNIAQRLEVAAAAGGVLAGALTYRLVRHAVIAEPLAPLAVKGKADPLTAWRLTAVHPTAEAVPRHMDSEMVGRDPQLRILTDAAARSRDERAPQLVTVLGLAGVGKSRLVHEFLSRVRADVTVIRGHCLSYGDAISYWPLAEALRAVAGIQLDDSPDIAIQRLSALTTGMPQARVVTERVAAAIGLGTTDRPSASGRQETSWAFRRLFESLARRRPLVAIFDDVQWGTPTFLDLLEHIVDRARDAPMLVVAIARPELLEVRPTWGAGKPRATTVLLEPLDDASVAQILNNLVGHPLPDELMRTIEDAAEGNPLFVEELLSVLVDDGTLDRDGDAYRLTRTPSQITVPATIEGLLAARLDRLPPEELDVLGRAAVIGKRFGASEVVELSPRDEQPAVLDRLMVLVRKELLRIDEDAAPDIDDLEGDVRFRFRHQLMRDAAYEGLAKHERARLHEEFADWMERTLGDRLEQLREVIGYHLEQAAVYREQVSGEDESVKRLGQRAAGHLEAAARRADAIFDEVAVLRLLSRANDLRGPDDPERLANLPKLARALWGTGRLDEARAALGEVLASPEADAPTRAQALEATWVGSAAGQSAAEMRRGIEEALRIRRELGEPAGIARALLALSEVAGFTGQLKNAYELAEQALGYAVKAEDVELQGRARHYRTSSYLDSVDATPDQAMLMLEEDLTFARGHGQRAMESVTLLLMGRLSGERGARTEAHELFERGLALQRDLGWELTVLSDDSDARLDYWAGDARLAADRLRTICRHLSATGERGYLSTAATRLAQCLIDLGETEEAENALRTAAETGAPDDVVTQVPLKAARARLLARGGALADAESMAREAVGEAEALEYGVLVPSAHLALGDVLRLAGRPAEAAAEWRAMIAFVEARGNRLYAGRLRRELEELEQTATRVTAG